MSTSPMMKAAAAGVGDPSLTQFKGSYTRQSAWLVAWGVRRLLWREPVHTSASVRRLSGERRSKPKIRFVALVGWAITHSATELGKLLFR